MNSNFPRTLALLRHEKKISQRVAAFHLDVSQAVLSHYENGLREPGLDFVARAADYYKVSSDFLLGRTMSREDYTISAEDLPDVSEQKDNVLRGSMLAMLNRKLLINAQSVLFDILGKSKDKKLINDASMYLNVAVYKLFRYIYEACGENAGEMFSIPGGAWKHISDAELNLCEMRFETQTENANLPLLSADSLKADYPALLQSLLSVMQNAGKRLEEHVPNEKSKETAK